MDYIELECIIDKNIPIVTDILTANLGYIGFDSFSETETGVLAYIQEDLFDMDAVNNIEIVIDNAVSKITYNNKKVETINWNKEWEKNYDPIIVSDECIVRAPFHTFDTKYKYDIIINPQMSFGTGHHETTYLILKELLDLDLDKQTVLDMGCGTGILGILASMRGASKVTAIDNDDWVIDNLNENIANNNMSNIDVFLGDFSIEFPHIYDTIIANINRNALLEGIKSLAKVIKTNGTLILSGLYIEDKEIIVEEASKHNFKFVSDSVKKNWIALKFTKQ